MARPGAKPGWRAEVTDYGEKRCWMGRAGVVRLADFVLFLGIERTRTRKIFLAPEGDHFFAADPAGLAVFEAEADPAEERFVDDGERAGGEGRGFCVVSASVGIERSVPARQVITARRSAVAP